MFNSDFATNFQQDNECESQLAVLRGDLEKLRSRINELESQADQKTNEQVLSNINKSVIDLYGLINNATRSMSSCTDSKFESVFNNLNDLVIKMNKHNSSIQSDILEVSKRLIQEQQARIQDTINSNKKFEEERLFNFHSACYDKNINTAFGLFHSFNISNKKRYFEELLNVFDVKKNDLDEIFDFIDHLNDHEFQIKAYKKLLLIINLQEKLRFGYFLKRFMDSSKNLSATVKNDIELCKSSLPESVQKIYWQPFVYLKNQYYNELMRSDGKEKLTDGGDDLVFTEKNSSFDCQWKLITDDHGKTFKILSNQRNKYLYRSSIQVYDNHRYKCGLNEKSFSYWRIHLNGNNNEIYITEKETENYLYTGFQGSLFSVRYVLCWSDKDTLSLDEYKNRKWIVMN